MASIQDDNVNSLNEQIKVEQKLLELQDQISGSLKKYITAQLDAIKNSKQLNIQKSKFNKLEKTILTKINSNNEKLKEEQKELNKLLELKKKDNTITDENINQQKKIVDDFSSAHD